MLRQLHAYEKLIFCSVLEKFFPRQPQKSGLECRDVLKAFVLIIQVILCRGLSSCRRLSHWLWGTKRVTATETGHRWLLCVSPDWDELAGSLPGNKQAVLARRRML